MPFAVIMTEIKDGAGAIAVSDRDAVTVGNGVECEFANPPTSPADSLTSISTMRATKDRENELNPPFELEPSFHINVPPLSRGRISKARRGRSRQPSPW
jgi:hypothetical protein